MKTVHVLQIWILLAITGNSLPALAQESVNVRISPDSKSTLIGKLASLSLAVNAEWPKGTDPVPGWRPIYYRGEFLVYLDSQDVGKNFLPLPGSRYLLSPSLDAPLLTIATDEDDAEIVSIDPRYCHINLKTIVLGYIEDRTTPVPPRPRVSEPRIVPMNRSTPDGSEPDKSMQGILIATNSFESAQSGYKFKLINDDNEIVAFVDHSRLPATVPIGDFINTRLTAWGTIGEIENVDAVVLRVKLLKKKN